MAALSAIGLAIAWQAHREPAGVASMLAALFALLILLSVAIAALTWRDASRSEDQVPDELPQFLSLVAQLHEGVVILDTGGRISYANPTACKLLGLPSSALVGRPDVENGWLPLSPTSTGSNTRVLPDIDAHARAGLSSADPDTSASQGQQLARYRRSDQTELELTYRLVRLHHRGSEPARCVGYAWLFRETASAAAALKQTLDTQVLGLAFQAKSTFMMSIAHELRNPLAAISGSVHLIERQLGPRSDSRLESNLHILKSATKHLGNVIDTVFDNSRKHIGQPVLRVDALALSPLIRDAVGMVADIANESGIRLSADQFDPTLLVRADTTRLMQVLINLLSNAIKYNRPAGSVFVRVASTRDEVMISVEDTGYGISPQNLTRIFHLFERADAAAGTIGGAGIGLALAKYYVERMHGRIEVTSAIGAGSRFTIILPRAASASTTTRTQPDAAASA
jgi:signal transduction histidine kinase